MMIKYSDLAVRGIDVSQYNGVIDWSKVTADFAAIRVGYGRLWDLNFTVNWAGAKGKTFRFPYWYMDYYSNHDDTTTAYGISDVDWGIKQANVWWNAVKNDPSGIVFLDIEKASIGPALSTVKERVLTVAKAFLERADELSGKTNGVYLSLSMLTFMSDWFKNRPLWVAWYTDTQTVESVLAAVKAKGWTGKPLIWQYASDGDIDGDGAGDGIAMGMQYKFLDLNVWLGSETEYKEWTGENMLLDIKPLSQVDEKWRYEKLGTSSSTIGGYGCLITSVSMMLNHFGFDTDPSRLNKLLIANDGYYNSNLFVWNSLKTMFEGVTFANRYDGFLTDKVDEQLKANKPVIVHVDYVPSTPTIDEHWVLIVGKVDNKYIINDPKDGTQLKLADRYTNGVFHVCTYNYEEQETTMPETALYSVRINSGITKLIIRSTPSTSGSKLGYATELGTYPIYEVSNGYGKISTGKWISLNTAYVTKVETVENGKDGELYTDTEKLQLVWEWYVEEH